MCAYDPTAQHASRSSAAAWLTWIGGGERRELQERHERSAHAGAGVVVLATVALTLLVTTLAVLQAMHLPVLAVAPFTLALAVLIGAVSRTSAAGSSRGAARRGTVIVSLTLGAAVGEFASLAILSGPIDHHLEQQAARDAASTPAVVQASGNLQRMRDDRAALDRTVDVARVHRDEALVTARCEYHPTPACPQTHITGVPGSGPETRTANQLLADSEREFDDAVAARDRNAPDMDAHVVDGERALADSRRRVEADHSVGARWVAMQQLTSASTSTLILRLLTTGFFVLLALLPAILRVWRGETTHDRRAQARAERERAELTADTAIAVKRAELRTATEIMWAEEQLAQTRLALEAQTEIARAQLRRRVQIATEGMRSDDDIDLPIAVEAETASTAEMRSIGTSAAPAVAETDNLPAIVERPKTSDAPTIPTIPNVTKAAARWLRPLVPSFVGRAIDTSTHPLRTARQVIEEVEEITFSLRRTHKITVHSEESSAGGPARDDFDGPATQSFSLRRLASEPTGDGPTELRANSGPRKLPPATE